PSEGTADQSLQLTAYSILGLHEFGDMPEELALDYVTRTKGGKLSQYTQTTHRGAEDLAAFRQRAFKLVDAVSADVYLPAPADSWQCSDKFCPFFTDCEFVVSGAKRHEN
ncbi:MAG: hypothetical protein ACPGWS_09070, partial [Solirubrobacterales bacterium]